jgi:hypothetical protein
VHRKVNDTRLLADVRYITHYSLVRETLGVHSKVKDTRLLADVSYITHYSLVKVTRRIADFRNIAPTVTIGERRQDPSRQYTHTERHPATRIFIVRTYLSQLQRGNPRVGCCGDSSFRRPKILYDNYSKILFLNSILKSNIVWELTTQSLRMGTYFGLKT